ncbi:hypothetical protein IMSHALPRED_010178 [Imshaugia aleurites]|uniref:Uncharacterized protein n=1 Tax=Imshaugia aleurites TaxID=172621 RepID=A0A8H3IP94_9LECA|nr:hypothetical protein IMSHALPRED_010178 [Imshaugia aleurites]
MGCTSSRPSAPHYEPQRQTNRPRNHNDSRLSRPFDPNIPLYGYEQSSSRPVGPERYEDAYSQLNARSKKNRAQSVRPVGPERYGDAYAQLSARSKQNRAQTGRKDQKVQYAQGPRVKSQAAQRVKGNTLYFSN